MPINAGIWIDHHQAVVVIITDAGEELLQFTSDQGSRARSIRGAQKRHTYTPNDFVAEDKLERKAMISGNQFYDVVIARLGKADAILVMGPGEAKGEFAKRLAGTKLKGRVAEMETADKMTDDQIAAHVRQHFHNANTIGSQ